MARWITNSEEEVKTTAGELGWGKIVALSVGAIIALSARKDEKPFLRTLALLGLVFGGIVFISKNTDIKIGWSMSDDSACDCDCDGDCDCNGNCDCGDDCACKQKAADLEAQDLAD